MSAPKTYAQDSIQSPFGMVMPGRNWTAASSNGYGFGFNGKLKDDELKGNSKSYDFGDRIYDSRIGLWFSIDPEFKQFSFISPYSGFGNNPIIFMDIDGRVLKVSVSNETDRLRVQAALQKLTNDKVEILADGTVKLTQGNMNPSFKLTNGTQLLRDISNHKFTATISINDQNYGSSVKNQNELDATNGVGTNVNVTLSKLNGNEQVDDNGKTVEQPKDESIVLGSELIHALISMDGNSRMDQNVSNTYINIFGDYETEVYPLEEIAVHCDRSRIAVPTRGKRSKYITENDLKRDRKLKERVAYDSVLAYKYKPENKEKLEKYEKENK